MSTSKGRSCSPRLGSSTILFSGSTTCVLCRLEVRLSHDCRFDFAAGGGESVFLAALAPLPVSFKRNARKTLQSSTVGSSMARDVGEGERRGRARCRGLYSMAEEEDIWRWSYICDAHGRGTRQRRLVDLRVHRDPQQFTHELAKFALEPCSIRSVVFVLLAALFTLQRSLQPIPLESFPPFDPEAASQRQLF